mmetsp:Transcript_1430/g.4991  ORF Transcript_1430/g.4991 Transcript_1430/m.4991 type:complete len:205 (+) Transcript_1430:193-807(+)
MLRLRSNALRLTQLSRRPRPQAVDGVGLWATLLFFEALVCALVNPLIVAVSSDQLDALACWTHELMRGDGDCGGGTVPMSARFLIAIAAEHVLLICAVLLYKLLPRETAAVRAQLQRQAFLFTERSAGDGRRRAPPRRVRPRVLARRRAAGLARPCEPVCRVLRRRRGYLRCPPAPWSCWTASLCCSWRPPLRRRRWREAGWLG